MRKIRFAAPPDFPGNIVAGNLLAVGQFVAGNGLVVEIAKFHKDRPLTTSILIKDQPLSEKHQRWGRQRTTLVICIHRDKSIESLASSLVVLPGIEAVGDLCDGKRLTLAPSGESAVGLVALARNAGGSTLLKLKAPPARRPLAKLIDDFSTPVVVASLERAEVQVVPRNRDVDWKYHVVRSSNSENMPGTVTYKVHHGLSLDPSGPIYVVYQGGGEVQLNFSVDDEHFIPADEQGFNRPIPIPMGVKLVRFMLPGGGSTLDGFVTIATEKTAEGNF